MGLTALSTGRPRTVHTFFLGVGVLSTPLTPPCVDAPLPGHSRPRPCGTYRLTPKRPERQMIQKCPQLIPESNLTVVSVFLSAYMPPIKSLLSVSLKAAAMLYFWLHEDLSQITLKNAHSSFDLTLFRFHFGSPNPRFSQYLRSLARTHSLSYWLGRALV